jgi:hypothetical protein
MSACVEPEEEVRAEEEAEDRGGKHRADPLMLALI